MKKAVRSALKMARRAMLDSDMNGDALSAVESVLLDDDDGPTVVVKASNAAATTTERPVVICTDKRGVFFGYATDTTGDSIVMTRPRMCVYWDAATKGVLGLAATGPTAGCRITQAPPKIELRGITCVIECDPAAVAAWEKGPWTK